MKASQASATVSALAQLAAPVPPAHLASLIKVLGTRSKDLSARDVSTVMHSLASMGARPTAKALDLIGYRAHLLLKAQMSALGTGGSGVMDGGEDSAAPSPSSLSSVEGRRRTKEHDTFAPQGISMLLHSAAVMGYANAQLTSSVAEAAVHGLSSFTPQGVSNTLWAAAKLNHYSLELVKACLGYFAKRGAEFKPQETANIMWALIQLRHHPQV